MHAQLNNAGKKYSAGDDEDDQDDYDWDNE